MARYNSPKPVKDLKQVIKRLEAPIERVREGPLCLFCESVEELVPCDWPVYKPTPKAVELAQVGDVWITQQAGKRGRISQIEPFLGQLKFWVLIPGFRRPCPYYRWKGTDFMTEGIATCDQQACWRHTREVDEHRHYCMTHWTAWEGMAA